MAGIKTRILLASAIFGASLSFASAQDAETDPRAELCGNMAYAAEQAAGLRDGGIERDTARADLMAAYGEQGDDVAAVVGGIVDWVYGSNIPLEEAGPTFSAQCMG